MDRNLSGKYRWTHCVATFVIAIWLGLCAVRPALAQSGTPTDIVVSKEAWVVSYALVILFVGLGLFIVSIPSRREKKVRKK